MGLIVGIPVFTFLLDILGVKSDHIRRERLEIQREGKIDGKEGIYQEIRS